MSGRRSVAELSAELARLDLFEATREPCPGRDRGGHIYFTPGPCRRCGHICEHPDTATAYTGDRFCLECHYFFPNQRRASLLARLRAWL